MVQKNWNSENFPITMVLLLTIYCINLEPGASDKDQQVKVPATQSWGSEFNPWNPWWKEHTYIQKWHVLHSNNKFLKRLNLIFVIGFMLKINFLLSSG